MKKKNNLPGTAVLSIKPWVLFRPYAAGQSRAAQKVSIFIKNLEDDSHYAFEGPSACLWLLIDGVRTIDGVIGQFQKRVGTRDPKRNAVAREFLNDLLGVNLVMDISGHVKKDVRAQDMKRFLGQILKNRLLGFLPLELKVRLGRVKNRPGDIQKIAEVKKKFSGLIRSGARLKIKRDISSEVFNGQFHVFKADLSWASQKTESSVGFGASVTPEGAAPPIAC